jgi:hypothetical protein
MAAAHVMPSPVSVGYKLSSQADRQAMIDSVLGTRGADGEPPSEEALRLMQSFIAGEITMDGMSEAILSHAHRMVHEANARRLAVR